MCKKDLDSTGCRGHVRANFYKGRTFDLRNLGRASIRMGSMVEHVDWYTGAFGKLHESQAFGISLGE